VGGSIRSAARMLRGWFLGRRSRLIWCWVIGEADLGVPLLRVVGSSEFWSNSATELLDLGGV